MKWLAIVSLMSFLVLVSSVSANLEYFGVENRVDKGGNSFSALTIIFPEPTETFQFSIQAPITSLVTDMNTVCTYQGTLVTAVKCNLKLNQTSRTIKLNFTGNAFIEQRQNSYSFSQRFVVNDNILRTTNTLLLPVGMSLSSDPSALYPEDAQKLSNGQNIIVFWEQKNLEPNQLLSFQALYQPVFSPSSIPIWQLLLVGGAAALVAGFFVYRRFRKPEEVVLSVLDEYERKVMEVIQLAGGMINQRKVVEHTNFSKAKVSRVVKSLVKRGVIEAERRGRTNILHLKKKFGMSKPETEVVKQNSLSEINQPEDKTI